MICLFLFFFTDISNIGYSRWRNSRRWKLVQRTSTMRHIIFPFILLIYIYSVVEICFEFYCRVYNNRENIPFSQRFFSRFFHIIKKTNTRNILVPILYKYNKLCIKKKKKICVYDVFTILLGLGAFLALKNHVIML